MSPAAEHPWDGFRVGWMLGNRLVRQNSRWSRVAPCQPAIPFSGQRLPGEQPDAGKATQVPAFKRWCSALTWPLSTVPGAATPKTRASAPTRTCLSEVGIRRYVRHQLMEPPLPAPGSRSGCAWSCPRCCRLPNAQLGGCPRSSRSLPIGQWPGSS